MTNLIRINRTSYLILIFRPGLELVSSCRFSLTYPINSSNCSFCRTSLAFERTSKHISLKTKSAQLILASAIKSLHANRISLNLHTYILNKQVYTIILYVAPIRINHKHSVFTYSTQVANAYDLTCFSTEPHNPSNVQRFQKG